MHSLRILVMILGLSIIHTIGADQTNPRLDVLFEELPNADNFSEANWIEQQIWTLWYKSGDQYIDRLMQESQSAMQQGQPEAALARLDEIVKLAPRFAEGWNLRATLLYTMGDYARSFSDIKLVLSLEPRHFGALSGSGLCYAALGNLKAALTAFQAALTINPWMPGIQNALEDIGQQLGARQRPI